MEPGLLVAPEQAVDAGQFQPDPRQLRADGQDRFEAPGGIAQMAEPGLSKAQQEQSFDLLFLVGRIGLLQERARVAKTAGLEQKPAELHVGRTVRRSGRLTECGRGEQQRRRDRNRERARAHLRVVFTGGRRRTSREAACRPVPSPA